MASFTSVLKKIGQVILAGSQVATQIMGFPFLTQLLSGANPKVGQIVNTTTSDLNTIAGIISTAEAMFPSANGSKTGSMKLSAASPIIQQALLTWATSNLPGHSKIKDPTLLAKASGEITGGFADFLNSLGD